MCFYFYVVYYNQLIFFYWILIIIYYTAAHISIINKGNNKITELRTILQRESQNS